MLVILMPEQIVVPSQVCQSCLLADSKGQPRWRDGKLCCGQQVRKIAAQQPDQYKCLMGFRIANID